jgi:riboflavin biosynthesis pyrimidine reductase
VRLLLPETRELQPSDLLDLYAPEPGVRAGFVLSVDGAVAAGGSSRPLQVPADEAVFHALRGVADAVLVGAGTARREDYGPVRPRPDGAAWRAARGLPEQPPLVLVSRTLDLDPAMRCFAGPCTVVTCAAAPGRDRFPDVVVAGDDEVDLPDAIAQLAERGLVRVLCEGGPTLLTALLAAGLVDELCLTTSPRLVGGAPGLLTAEQDAGLSLRSLVDGGDGALLARWSVSAPRRPSPPAAPASG